MILHIMAKDAYLTARGRPEPFRMMRGHTKDVKEVELFNDGRRIVTCSEDGIVRIWDVEKEEQFVEFKSIRAHLIEYSNIIH